MNEKAVLISSLYFIIQIMKNQKWSVLPDDWIYEISVAVSGNKGSGQENSASIESAIQLVLNNL